MKTFVLGPVLKLLFRPWVKGLDNVPAEGAAILASNLEPPVFKCPSCGGALEFDDLPERYFAFLQDDAD